MSDDANRGGIDVCHDHNLPPGFREQQRPYGIRVSLLPGESMCRLLGKDWHVEHWYATETQRERALADMLAEHPYSRFGDRPRIVCGRIGREAHAGRTQTRAASGTQALRGHRKRWWRR